MKPLFWVAIACVALTQFTHSAVYGKTQPLYQDEKPMELVLEADVVALLNDKSDEPEYTQARLIHPLGGNKISFFDLQVKPRGSTRRLTNLCEFPPLKFNFKKSQIKNTVFHGQDKLKFVSQCRLDDEFQNYIMEEYLLYKTYELLTEESFKTRLVSIIIKDIKLRVEPIQMMGFLIEDDKSLGKRIQAKKYEEFFYSQDSCDSRSLDRLALFQFMIGNTDWYVNTRHNTEILQNKADGSLIPIPYDFDFSGVINTFYAQPSTQIPITDVRQRFFKGSCRGIDEFQETIDLFNEKKEEIFALYESFEYLPKYAKKKSIKYYTKFYKLMNDPSEAESHLYQACNTDYLINSAVRKVKAPKSL